MFRSNIAAPLLLLGASVASCRAVVVAGASGGGNTSNNTTAAQYLSEIGTPLSIYDNVIQYSDASGVYLGYNASTHDVWVLTALHITTNVSAGSTVSIGGLTFDRQPEGGDGFGVAVGGDLRLVRYRRGDLAVPNLPAVTLSGTVPQANASLTMIGYGQNRTENAATNPVMVDATATGAGLGYHWTGPQIKRWGTNNIEAEFPNAFEVGTPGSGTTGTFSMGSYNTTGFVTDFDQPGSVQWQSSNEAQGSLGDSGGGAFTFVGGQWHLTGIFSAVSTSVGQAGSTSAFGNYSLITDVATYNSSISTAIGTTLVPEPTAALLTAAGGVALMARRRRRCASRD